MGKIEDYALYDPGWLLLGLLDGLPDPSLFGWPVVAWPTARGQVCWR
ncbi:MAG: hypothetical protein R2748_11395 [Bryobacterales bacterium]